MMDSLFLTIKECITFQLTYKWWLDIYFSPSSASSWSQKDLQGNRRSPERWRACQSLWTSPGDDHVCSVCQWRVWLRHGLWARNRPLLLWISCESNKVVHESPSTCTLRDLTWLHPLTLDFLTHLLNIGLQHEAKYSDLEIIATFLYENACFVEWISSQIVYSIFSSAHSSSVPH